MSDSNPRVAIIGGGFSGAMLAARLAERGTASTLIDRAGVFGPGAAYATTFDGHVLNVRAGRMSAVEGRPDDFVRWLRAHHPDHAAPEGFAPRRLYGLYLRDRLAEVEAARPGLVERIAGEAISIESATVRLADSRAVTADAVVLATGNPAPATAGGADGGAGRIIRDPWAPAALERIAPQDDVIVLGSGLTMVDVVLALAAAGWRGRMTALSRRGLAPRAHQDAPDRPVPSTDGMRDARLSRRLAVGRRRADEAGWRGMMEGLRPVTAELWASADAKTRARFLRHLRPWWDVHRHRIAAPVAAAVGALEVEGRLCIVAGRLDRIDENPAGVVVDWRPRGEGHAQSLVGQWLIDCTGPAFRPVADRLISDLIRSGRARVDPLGLGLDVDAAGRLIGADGAPDRQVFVLGPPARAAFWETTAVPDIRKHIEALAATLGPEGGPR